MTALVRKIMGAGMPAGLANSLLGDVQDSMTASGTSQSDAQVIGAAISRFTTVASGKGAILPAGAIGDECMVINAGANALSVYPPSGHAIEALSTNTAISVPTSSKVILKRISNLLWVGIDTFTQSGSGASSRTVSAKLQEHPSIEDYSSAGGVADQIQKAIDANVNKLVLARSSSYSVDAPVNITDGVYLKGQGLVATTFNRNFNGGSDSEGLFNIKSGANGTTLEGFSVLGGSGTTGGCLISNVAVLGAAADGSTLRDLWLSTNGTDTQTYTLYWDGSARTGAPLGVRDNTFYNVHVFGAATAAAYIKSVTRFGWYGGGVTVAGGSSGKLILTGTAGVPSVNISVNVPVLNSGLDALDLEYTNYAAFTIGRLGNVLNTANVTDVCVTAGVIGTVQTNWVRSSATPPGTFFYGSGAPSFAAVQGALYLRSDGSSSSTRAYINSDGSTTWVAVTTAS